jgi:hypothetical protein
MKRKQYTPETVSKILTLYQTGYSASEIRNRMNTNITTQEVVSLIGNTVGSLAVQIVCNREPVKTVDLIKFITRLLK